MGGKNPFLGIAYIVVGGLCILLGALFLVAWVVKPRYVSFGGVSGRHGADTIIKETRRPHLPLLGQGGSEHGDGDWEEWWCSGRVETRRYAAFSIWFPGCSGLEELRLLALGLSFAGHIPFFLEIALYDRMCTLLILCLCMCPSVVARMCGSLRCVMRATRTQGRRFWYSKVRLFQFNTT